jgi:hypothetical protein
MDGGASRFRRRGEKQIGSHHALPKEEGLELAKLCRIVEDAAVSVISG